MAMKTATEYIWGSRYKLCQIGIPINGPTFVYGDNKSVLINSSQPDSVLEEKNNSVAYNHVPEGSARDEWKVIYFYWLK